MECISKETFKVQTKTSLAFSIDKIIGTNRERSTEQVHNKTEHDCLNPVTEKERKDVNEQTGESFKPVRRRSDVMQAEMLKYQTQYQHAASLLKSEMQKRQLTSYLARDMYDVNMNSVPYLHPAFMLGRMCPDEYKAQIFQNLSALQQQWPNMNKDALYSLDLLRMSEVKGLTSQLNHLPEHMPRPDKKMTDSSQQDTNTPKEKSSDLNKQSDKHSVGSGSSQDDGTQDSVQVASPDKKGVPKTQKSFSCPECGKLFNAHYNLTRHMPVHTGKGL